MDFDRNNLYKKASYTVEEVNKNLNKLKLNVFDEKSEINILILKVKNEIDIIKKSIEDLKKPFLLFIMGPGKYGKTSLINSLIKEHFLEVRDIPNTWKLDSLVYGVNKRIEIIYDNKISRIYDYEEGKDIIKNEEIKFRNSKNKIRYELEKYKNKKKINKEELKNYKKILEDMYIYKSNICEVRYFIDKKGILNDFVIVDTPGLNQSLLENTNSRMLDYYNHADGIIWILDSQNVISKSSYELLEELKHNYSIEKNKDNIICVVNKIDTIKNKIKDKQKIIEKVDLLYEQNFKDIVMISARNAINGILNNDTNLIDISNIKSLENSIEINFKKKSEKIQVKSKQQGLKLMSKKIIEYINEYKRDLYFEIYKLNKNKKNIKEKLELVKIYTLEYVKIYISFENLIKNDINVEIRQLENIINKKINQDFDFEINFNVSICRFKEIIKLKALIEDYKKINEKKDLYLNILQNKSLTNNYKFNINRFIESLKNETISEVSKVLEIIEKNKVYDIEKSFRNRYTDIEVIKEHMQFINNIYDNVVIWGDKNE
ncbi:dynamin family protein [Paraclostridium sordellii]|uniref:dynamin family protein n=1 Tax=Paraclostridium sordellii TaxID=1505 RepID=UPI0005E66D6A|nr:dynamin family protein [Paeniclostridium sordellii]MDU1455110.1 dynamin family protein [Paeniclostridium sordellii]CEP39221.1 Predicted GTPase [[Clostridium] sordellii] [Paeniclostridium sordellii]